VKKVEHNAFLLHNTRCAECIFKSTSLILNCWSVSVGSIFGNIINYWLPAEFAHSGQNLTARSFFKMPMGRLKAEWNRKIHVGRSGKRMAQAIL
jgi:hypothetical protein